MRSILSLMLLLTLNAHANNEVLLKQIKDHHHLSDAAIAKISDILAKNPSISQGNPKSTKHPMEKSECRPPTDFKEITSPCTMPNMAPIGELDGKTICIDRFEFPDIPCEYPVTWVRASEAHEICEAMGKRLCDASEWEAACAGDPVKDRYVYSNEAGSQKGHAVQRANLNAKREKVWSYGAKEDQKKCATGSSKSPGCDKALASGKGVYESCGTNTYPAGAFPECKSSFGVYDLHGNAAEHMNLPIHGEAELTRKGGSGYTEMKGSWFVFQTIKAHADDCYWRAPFWHPSKVRDPKSHENYHLGFRCCM